MALRGTWIALIGLAVTGCSESHVGSEDGGRLDASTLDAPSYPDTTWGCDPDCGAWFPCAGPPPECRDEVAMGGPGCCGDVPRAATCVGSRWECPAGTTDTCTAYWVPSMCRTSVPECDGPSGCILRPASCCGACGTATPTDMIALPVSRVTDYTAMVCDGVGCPDCAGRQDPLLLATCQSERCSAVNLHTSPLTECTTSADCVLGPIRCCACGLLGEDEIASYNPARGSIAALTCDPDADCPPCVPDFGGASPFCDAGRCTFALPGGG